MAKNRGSRVRRVYRSVFRRGGGRRSKGKVSLAVVAGFLPLAIDGYSAMTKGWSGYTGLEALAGQLVYSTTGWNNSQNRWEMRGIIRGLGPVLCGALVHKAASMFGINRQIAKLRLPISI